MLPDEATRLDRIKVELERVRGEFLELLVLIPERDWDRSLPGEHWTARQEMSHVVQAVRTLPVGIRRATTDQGGRILALIPVRLRNWMNGYLIIPLISRGETRESVAAGYQKAHAALVALLEKLPDDSWGKGTSFGGVYRTVEQMAHRPAEHFAEHSAHLRRILSLPG